MASEKTALQPAAMTVVMPEVSAATGLRSATMTIAALAESPPRSATTMAAIVTMTAVMTAHPLALGLMLVTVRPHLHRPSPEAQLVKLAGQRTAALGRQSAYADRWLTPARW